MMKKTVTIPKTIGLLFDFNFKSFVFFDLNPKNFNVLPIILIILSCVSRTRGHLFTKTNPVRERRKYAPTLDLENFGLSHEDLQSTFNASPFAWL